MRIWCTLRSLIQELELLQKLRQNYSKYYLPYPPYFIIIS